MNKDFILITGHGIFPAASILQVVPVVDTGFEVTVTPPTTEDNKFVISVIKSTSVNVEIARANPTKKNDVETLTDYGYSRDVREQYDFEQDEFLSMLDLSDDSDLKGYIKDYNRRLKKVLDYQRAVTAIESNPDLPDYETSLAAVKQNAPSSSTERKQEKTLNKIRDFLLEKVLEVVESADDSDDYTGKKLMDIINSDSSQDSTENAANHVLEKFYNKNFGDGSGYEDFGEDSDDVEDVEDVDSSEVNTYDLREKMLHMTDEALDRADVIRTSRDTITNSLKTDQDEE